MALQAVVTAIKRYPNATMSIHTQPAARHRFRYLTDGMRYVESSRRNPMATNVVSSFNELHFYEFLFFCSYPYWMAV